MNSNVLMLEQLVSFSKWPTLSDASVDRLALFHSAVHLAKELLLSLIKRLTKISLYQNLSPDSLCGLHIFHERVNNILLGLRSSIFNVSFISSKAPQYFFWTIFVLNNLCRCRC